MLCHSLMRLRPSFLLPLEEKDVGYSGSLVPLGVMYFLPPPMITWKHNHRHRHMFTLTRLTLSGTPIRRMWGQSFSHRCLCCWGAERRCRCSRPSWRPRACQRRCTTSCWRCGRSWWLGWHAARVWWWRCQQTCLQDIYFMFNVQLL